MIEKRRRATLIAFSGLLLVIDWWLYFRHGAHFFQGDSIFLLNHRALSLPQYLRQFAALNPSGWYRPLSHELFESLLYPVAGLHPIPYLIPVYAFFIVVTILVYRLALQLTRRHLAAGFATLFFTIHTVNAYTTYDIAFMPELLFAFFYITATLLFLRYLQDESRNAYWLSAVCFVAGLLSKESAVTLPGVLFLATIAFDPEKRPARQRLVYAVRSVTPHALILVVYLVYAVGYLDVAGISVRGLFDQSQKPEFGDYTPVFNSGVLTDARLAASWAFNIPRGWWSQWQTLSPWMLTYLKFFRILVLVLAVSVLLRPERGVILFGIAWFWITVLPALPIATHFAPYYLFVPVVGLSLIVGAGFAIAYDWMRSIQPVLPAASILMIFAGLLYINSRIIGGDIRDNRILGGSSKLAADTLNDLKRLYPTLPSGMTLYFLDGAESVQWEHDFGGLIKMSYGDDRIETLYQSAGAQAPEKPDVLFLAVRAGHLVPAAERR